MIGFGLVLLLGARARAEAPPTSVAFDSFGGRGADGRGSLLIETSPISDALNRYNVGIDYRLRGPIGILFGVKGSWARGQEVSDAGSAFDLDTSVYHFDGYQVGPRVGLEVPIAGVMPAFSRSALRFSMRLGVLFTHEDTQVRFGRSGALETERSIRGPLLQSMAGFPFSVLVGERLELFLEPAAGLDVFRVHIADNDGTVGDHTEALPNIELSMGVRL